MKLNTKNVSKGVKQLITKARTKDGKILSKLIIFGAVICSIFFAQKMIEVDNGQSASMGDEVKTGRATGAVIAEVEYDNSTYQESQVIRELDLGMFFDTEHGVTVRNLNTSDCQRMTEPGIVTDGSHGDTYSYAIEERADGGQDLMVSMRINGQNSYMISYQAYDGETGDREVTNLTVVNGTVTAESTVDMDVFMASNQ